MAPGAAINGLTGIHGGIGGSALVGAGYDGRNPRIKLQLERTGLEYLVVRRHQDPIGQALKRLSQLPGADRNRRIPEQNSRAADGTEAGRHGLSQSLREARNREPPATNDARSSYEGHAGGQGDSRNPDRESEDDDGVGAILRSIWEKNFDLNTGADC